MGEISKDFRKTREALNLSQLDVAMLLNTSRVTYNKWEQDPDTMPLGKYQEMMRTFDRIKKLKGDK